MSKLRSLSFVAIATCFLGLSAIASASVSVALSLEELVASSDEVVLGTVTGQQARYDKRRRIVTDVTLRVDDTMKGNRAKGAEIIVTRFGGEIGDLGMRVEGEPNFTTGEQTIVFAKRLSAASIPQRALPRFRAVGMSQGVLRIESNAGRQLVMPNGNGLALMRRTPRGQLAAASAAVTAPRELTEIVSEIRQIAANAATRR